MATLQDLLDSVIEDVHGGSFTNAVILRYLNEALYRQAATRYLLPDLAQSGTLATDPNNPLVPMPLDYHRNLQYVTSVATQNRIYFEKSFVKFMRYYPMLDQYGNVERCTLRSQGTLLYYQPNPGFPGDTLNLWYFRKPVPMTLTNLDGTPDGLPDEFHDGVLAGYAKWKLWKKIEQDETKKNNAGAYHAEFDEAMAELGEYLGPDDGEATYIGDEMFYAINVPLVGTPWSLPG